MGQIKIDELNQDNFEVLYEEPVRINDDEKEGEREEGLRQEKDLATAGKLSEETLKELKVRKNEVLHYFKRGLDMASSIQQYSLVFNGAIYIWNNFLHIFRSPSNDVKLKSEVPAILKDFFEAMKNCLKEI